MTSITVIHPKKMAAILKKLGFRLERQKGSHAYYKHPDGRSTVVPMHHGEDLGKGIIRQILSSIEISAEEYEKLRKSV